MAKKAAKKQKATPPKKKLEGKAPAAKDLEKKTMSLSVNTFGKTAIIPVALFYRDLPLDSNVTDVKVIVTSPNDRTAPRVALAMGLKAIGMVADEVKEHGMAVSEGNDIIVFPSKVEQRAHEVDFVLPKSCDPIETVLFVMTHRDEQLQIVVMIKYLG
jgi:hypothetical protein